MEVPQWYARGDAVSETRTGCGFGRGGHRCVVVAERERELGGGCLPAEQTVNGPCVEAVVAARLL